MAARNKKVEKKRPPDQTKLLSSDMVEARRLLGIVEKSQVPFGESAPTFAELKAKIEKGDMLTVEEHEDLLRLVNMAKKWNRDVEASARTEPDETMAG